MSLDTNNVIRIPHYPVAGWAVALRGRRLTGAQVRDALRRSHLGWLLPLNFVAVPLVTLAVIRGFQVPPEIAIGMVLLGASPFARVVPVSPAWH